MIQKRNEVGDGPLKVDVVFPKRVVGVNEQDLAAILHDCGVLIIPMLFCGMHAGCEHRHVTPSKSSLLKFWT
jgi:hypothetical protein